MILMMRMGLTSTDLHRLFNLFLLLRCDEFQSTLNQKATSIWLTSSLNSDFTSPIILGIAPRSSCFMRDSGALPTTYNKSFQCLLRLVRSHFHHVFMPLFQFHQCLAVLPLLRQYECCSKFLPNVYTYLMPSTTSSRYFRVENGEFRSFSKLDKLKPAEVA